MKTVKKSTLQLYFLIAFLGFIKNADAKIKTEKIVIKTTIYCDHCNECESCGQFLRKEIKYIKGVKFASLDIKEMAFIIEFNPTKTTPDAIRTAISKLGYDADHIKADPDAYNKLDACCKKPG